MKKLISTLLVLALLLGGAAIPASASTRQTTTVTHSTAEWNGVVYMHLPNNNELRPTFGPSNVTITLHFDDGSSSVLPAWDVFCPEENTYVESPWASFYLRDLNLPQNLVELYIQQQSPIPALALNEPTDVSADWLSVYSFTAQDSGRHEFRRPGNNFGDSLKIAIHRASNMSLIPATLTSEQTATADLVAGETYYVFIAGATCDDNQWGDHLATESTIVVTMETERWSVREVFRFILAILLWPFSLLIGAAGMFIVFVGVPLFALLLRPFTWIFSLFG